MTAVELARGQNHPLPGTRLTVRVSADGAPATAVLLTDDAGRLCGESVVHRGAPELPGVRLTLPDEAALDLGVLPVGVRRVLIALILPPGRTFGALAAPKAVVETPDGTCVAAFTLAGLSDETAVVAVELYARGPAWKLRAVGQGYTGGAPALLADHAAPEPTTLARTLTPTADALVDAAHPQSDSIPPTAGGASGTPVDTGYPGRAADPPAAGSGLPIDTVHPRREAVLPAAGGASGSSVDTAYPGRAADPAAAGSGLPIDTVHPRREAVPPGADAAAPPVGGAASVGPINTVHPRRAASSPPAASAAVPPVAADAAGPGSGATPPPVAGDAAGFTMDERLYNQVWGIFEDAARSAAAYRSAVDYADQREAREVEALLADPRTRFGPEAESGRAEARARRDDLETRAREVFERDARQLREELDVVEQAMPAPMARWDSPAWSAWQPPAEPPYAVRLGDLHLPENPDLRVPMLVRFPPPRGLWVDTGSTGAPIGAADRKVFGTAVAVATAARLLACRRPGDFVLHAIAPGGTDGGLLAPFARAGLLAGPPAGNRAEIAALLEHLVERADLAQMARRAGAADVLPPHLDPADRLLLVHDFPYGFDDRTVARLRYLAEEGPAVGVHLLLLADRADSREYGPLLDSFWRSLTRIAPVPDDYLADPWVEHLWTFTPAVPPAGDPVVPGVLARIARSAGH